MLDAVTIEILWSRITSIVDEAAKVIIRTSFSTLSNEANDFACVLTDAMGQSLVQNTGSIPSFIGTLPATVRHFLGEFGPDSPDGGMQDGDVYITNNPWQGTGHLPDVCVAKPVFRNGRLVAFAAACSHVPDIGGMVRLVEPRRCSRRGCTFPDALHAEWRGRCESDRVVAYQCTDARSDPGRFWALVGAVELMARRLVTTSRNTISRIFGVGRRAVFALRGRDAGCDPHATGRHLPLRFRYRRSGRPFRFELTLTIPTARSPPIMPARRRSSRAPSTAR